MLERVLLLAIVASIPKTAFTQPAPEPAYVGAWVVHTKRLDNVNSDLEPPHHPMPFVGTGTIVDALQKVKCLAGPQSEEDCNRTASSRMPLSYEEEAADTVGPQRLVPEAVAQFGNCTATHIGNGFYLTAGHCVTREFECRGHQSGPCPYSIDPYGTDLHFGGRNCHVASFGFGCEADKRLISDFAVLKLKVDPPASFPPLPFYQIDYAIDWENLGVRELSMMGYSRGNLYITDRCNGVYDNQTRLVFHRCNSRPGDSGSALIDRESNRIVAIHAGKVSQRLNYAVPVQQIPWEDSICHAVRRTKKKAPIVEHPPYRIIVSSSGSETPVGSVLVDVHGTHPNPSLLSFTLKSALGPVPPMVPVVVDDDWYWKRTLELSNPAMAGRWKVEISGSTGSLHGEVEKDARLYLCP